MDVTGSAGAAIARRAVRPPVSSGSAVSAIASANSKPYPAPRWSVPSCRVPGSAWPGLAPAHGAGEYVGQQPGR